MVLCFNNRQPYVHVRFHDQFVMWYQNRYMMCAGFLGVGGCRLARVGYCGTVNIGHDEDLELWLYLEYHVIAILVPVKKIGTNGVGRVVLVPSS